MSAFHAVDVFSCHSGSGFTAAANARRAVRAAQNAGDNKRFGLAIVRRFDFTSVHQRMSVVVRTESARSSSHSCLMFMIQNPSNSHTLTIATRCSASYIFYSVNTRGSHVSQ